MVEILLYKIPLSFFITLSCNDRYSTVYCLFTTYVSLTKKAEWGVVILNNIIWSELFYDDWLPSECIYVAVYFEFLLCFYCAHVNNEAGKKALQMVGETLMAIDQGGIHDHIGKVCFLLAVKE